MDKHPQEELLQDTLCGEIDEAVNSISLKESDETSQASSVDQLPSKEEAVVEISVEEGHELFHSGCLDRLSPEGVTEEDEDQRSTCLWSLDTLPLEVFLHICSFLDAKFLACTMRLVCKYFHSIFSDEALWRSRVGRRWNSVYPPLPVKSEEFSWMKACTLIEEDHRKWSSMSETMRRVTITDVHYASVDAVLLMNSGSLLISGSRDHSIIAWNLENIHDQNWGTFPPVIIKNAHEGWVWNLAAKNDVLYSCSWDSTVKTWQVEGRGLLEVSTSVCRCAVLSLACNDSMVAAGLYSREVNLYDPRSGTKFISSYCAHRGPVLALAMTENFIVSASDDKTLAVWDQRAGKILKKKITLPTNTGERLGCTPMCLSLNKDILYVGDSVGQLHLLNPAGGLFEVVTSYDTGHVGKLTAVQHNLGCVVTSSTDKSLRVLTPTQPPQLIGVIPSAAGEVTGFDYKNNILAVGGTDSAVELWIPRSAAAAD